MLVPLTHFSKQNAYILKKVNTDDFTRNYSPLKKLNSKDSINKSISNILDFREEDTARKPKIDKLAVNFDKRADSK